MKEDNKENTDKKIRLRKWLLITAGGVSFVLGVIGLFLPVFPTSPFILLAAAFFARSSQKFNNWLVNNRLFGKYVREYQEDRAIPLWSKVTAVPLILAGAFISCFFATDNTWARITIAAIALAVIIYVVSLKSSKG
jgi:uncharacterized membrane protein YbaN (DUF454 family)